jgi:N-acyl-L-homoserine lactone synthetase
VRILSGTPANLPPHLIAAIARYRYRLFVERMGWPLAGQDGLEFDQFDRCDTVYLAAHDRQGALVGTARLLPTDRPYLLGDVFPKLLDDPPPRSAGIWELSRFAAVDLACEPDHATAGHSSPVAIALLEAALSQAWDAGAQRLITVSPPGIERLLRRSGFVAARAGPLRVLDGHVLFACWIEVRHFATAAAKRASLPR